MKEVKILRSKILTPLFKPAFNRNRGIIDKTRFHRTSLQVAIRTTMVPTTQVCHPQKNGTTCFHSVTPIQYPAVSKIKVQLKPDVIIGCSVTVTPKQTAHNQINNFHNEIYFDERVMFLLNRRRHEVSLGDLRVRHVWLSGL